MFSVIFPGQGSQSIGMGKEIYDKYQLVKELFVEANDILNLDLSKLIFEGPKGDLDLTLNTQPAIFLVSYSIFNVIKQETKVEIDKAKFFAGHSLGEYSALSCAGVISFKDTLKLLKIRGNAMQNAVPKNEGCMVAVLGEELKKIEEVIENNKAKYSCFLANDNSNGQVVVSGKIKDIDQFIIDLKKLNIKTIKLPVSAPFHCPLMKPATEIMSKELSQTKFGVPNNMIVSNVTAEPSNDPDNIRELLINQIEKPVRWRESIINMIKLGNKKFIEIGPGKVLSGLVKRIDRNVELFQVNNMNDLNNLTKK